MTLDRITVGTLLQTILPVEQIKNSLVDIVARAPDAGFYQLTPCAVVRPVSTAEIKELFQFSTRYNIPLVFRTGGTSLSGQSVTDGILIDLSQYWAKAVVENNGEEIRVQPGITGAMVNAYLKKYGRKIGPDPASINAAMMGGIIANNASGMCCGVSRNSYHTVKHLNFMLPNGLSYSTEKPADYERFKKENFHIYQKIQLLREQILNNNDLVRKITVKYQTKNTVGYAMNAFIDHQHPLDILARLLIGSEGTLGFIAEAVMQTVPDYPAKLTGLLYFPDIYTACEAILPLTRSGAETVELMDRASLRSVEAITGVPPELKMLPDGAAALLVEFHGDKIADLYQKLEVFHADSTNLNFLYPPVFTASQEQQAVYWKIRKGMFPTVGAIRKSGHSVILEDIGFPVARLGDAISDLRDLFHVHGYDDAIIFGHAKDGNIHFVITQTFAAQDEISRYDLFLRDVVDLVVKKYDGALKAEHGTGRNMAPFVETEWGTELYGIMKELKYLVDPKNLLNPGVIINEDKAAHIHFLKEMPGVEAEVDKCIECGFCEHMCPSRNITLTPRQRIVVRRGLETLKQKGEHKLYKELLNEYQYEGLDTCAVDGLCAVHCPVDINTGNLVKRLRRENHSRGANKVALIIATHFNLVAAGARQLLWTGNQVNKLLGQDAMRNTTRLLKKVIPPFPLWSNQLKAARRFKVSSSDPTRRTDAKGTLIYFPTCINRVMGHQDDDKDSLVNTFFKVAKRSGFKVLVPKGIHGFCCGQIFSSKGFNDAYVFAVNQTIDSIWEISQEGAIPVVLDVTSCTQTLQQCYPALTEDNKQKFNRLKIMDSVEFIADLVLPNVAITHKIKSIVLHPVCSLQKMDLSATFLRIAKRLAENVTVPVNAGCCGMAGDRGFLHPELTRSATFLEAEEVKQTAYDGYFSSGKTCEIAMSEAVNKNYESILYLVDALIINGSDADREILP